MVITAHIPRGILQFLDNPSSYQWFICSDNEYQLLGEKKILFYYACIINFYIFENL